MKTQFHKGFSISFNEKTGLYTARNGHKVAAYDKDKDSLIYAIEAQIKNKELSKKIDLMPQGKSKNPNVRR